MLRPEQREDRQLEVVRRAAQQLADAVELAVREAETAVERFRDRAQGSSVSGVSVGPTAPARLRKDVTRRRPIVLLSLLALIWGSSFMFIKVAVRDLDPSTLILGRCGIAAAGRAVAGRLSIGGESTVEGLRAAWRP